MTEEFVAIEQLERVKRLIESSNTDLAVATIEAMIEGRRQRIEQFERDMWENVPV
jgi:hypothetical protein